MTEQIKDQQSRQARDSQITVDPRASRIEQEQVGILKSLHSQIDRSNRQIVQMKQQIESVQSFEDEGFDLTSLVNEKKAVELSMKQARDRVTSLKENLDVKQRIFKEADLFKEKLFR